MESEETRIRRVMEENIEIWLKKKSQAKQVIVLAHARLTLNRRKAGILGGAATRAKRQENKNAAA